MVALLRIVAFVVVLAMQYHLNAQQSAFRVMPEKDIPWQKWNIRDSNAVKEFYRTMEYKPAWTGNEGRYNFPLLINLLQHADEHGLEEKDYQFEMLTRYRDSLSQLQFGEERIMHEVKLTDAALHFFHDIAFGNTVPLLGYHGLSYKPDCISVPWQLARHIQYNELGKLIYVLQPPMTEVKALRSAIVRLTRIMKDTGYREEQVVSSKISITNKPLLRKLFYLGVLDSLNKSLPDKSLQVKVKEGQRLFSLLDDGVLRSTYLQELNIPITARVKQLSIAINYYRWLYCITRKQPVVVVNIPAAYMKVYSEGKTVMEMRVIVGKPSTPTPTLSSTITEVILYPYWMVPQSIATKELLPSIKRNPGYIDAHSYQVLNRQGKIVDPYSINWQSLSAKNFPYHIRQSTGCDNALGLLKLNFHSPYSVYLHDTPSKSLFMLNKRFFSHGCMRMEKPTDLAHMVMANNEIAIDTLTEKGCLRNQAPIPIPAEVKLPVIIWYNPAGVNAAGKVIYFEDVYRKFSSF